MTWLAVDKDGTEKAFNTRPLRGAMRWDEFIELPNPFAITFPKGTFKKLIGRDLTWEDNLVELKEE